MSACPQPHSQPPQTPWIAHPRFADESLLMATQPIFDVSLGEESEWGMESPRLDSSTPRVKAMALVHSTEKRHTGEEGYMTLDLVDYLPEEMSYVSKGIEEKRTTHKRDLSLTLLADIPTKKAKAPRPINTSTNKDDLYSRRLSTSRPHSASSFQSPILPSLTLPTPPTSSDSTSASSSSSTSLHAQLSTHLRPEVNTASSRLKESIRQPRSAIPARGSAVTARTSQQGEEKISATSAVANRTSASALSRYLAKSTITNPIKVTPVTPPLQPQTATALIFTTPTSSSFPSSSSAQLDIPKDSANEPERPPTVCNTACLDDAPLSSVIPLTSNSRASSSATSVSFDDIGFSRRSSISSKVVNFLSGLVRSVSSSSLQEQDANVPSKPQSQDGEQKDERGKDEREGTDQNEVQDHRHPIKLTQGTRLNPHLSTKGRSHTAPLTKPIPFSRPIQHPKPPPLQPTRTQPSVPTRSQPSSTRTKTAPRSATTSAFASAALARLPPPGKGATSAGTRVEVKDGERARDLGARRGVFERLAGPSTTSTSKCTSPAPRTQTQRTSTAGIQKTVPVVGRTPGKASQLRAQQRSKFDLAVRQKMKEKEQQAREEAKRKEKEEEEEYRRRRKETVIWAKPVPNMYHQTRTE